MKVLLLFLVCVAVVVGGQDTLEDEYDLEFDIKAGNVQFHLVKQGIYSPDMVLKLNS